MCLGPLHQMAHRVGPEGTGPTGAAKSLLPTDSFCGYDPVGKSGYCYRALLPLAPAGDGGLSLGSSAKGSLCVSLNRPAAAVTSISRFHE